MNVSLTGIPLILLQERSSSAVGFDQFQNGWKPHLARSVEEASEILRTLRRHPLSELAVIAIDPFFPDLEVAWRRLRAVHPRVVVLTGAGELLAMEQVLIPFGTEALAFS